MIMLSQNTINIVKSTAPILQEHGETLTRHFYQRMFEHNPEVLPFFNSSNQEGGTQQRALAGAICAYAQNIDNLETLGSAVELIAQKHASLMIKEEHYPIVGENLLASIREVLGDGATDDIINAWGEAYWFLADILIGREQQIYDENANKPGGWDGFRAFKVSRKEAESEIITSFYLQPEDGGLLPSFLPGQYITLRMATPAGYTTMRNYSLSDVAGQNYLRISVKKEMGLKAGMPNGYVSNKLHDDVEVGAILEVGPPCGEFFLDTNKPTERPLVLLAAGVGITPILSMLKAALAANPDRDITFIYGCLNERVQAFKSIIDDLAASHPSLKVHYRYDEAEGEIHNNCSTGFVDVEFIQSHVETKASDYYFCGPKPFMINIYHGLLSLNVDEAHMHFEFFGPREELENANSTKAA